ncbi:DEAD domain-containing protein/Helicase_C domain-containing protein [Cephalotus follicularis]|uniref:DEAD domain-containing protein/Helicase_C domain-containing protein n=1 Tax=Cephalotus follicularis TaxID=3775 RepID=A0A1Q3CX89_CEPFO|nr:DEAD domain-containing protein/Helicase_C domain-containing protein [Cephalotus follicularis]
MATTSSGRAAKSAPQQEASQNSKKKQKRKRIQKDPELDRLDSLSWTSSLPQDDPSFSLFLGSSELGGGFLSLEEIDEGAYGLVISKPKKEKAEKSSKSKKRKHIGSDEGSGDGIETKIEEEVEEVKNVKDKKKKKKNNKRKAKNEPISEAVSSGKDDNEEELVDEAEIPPEFYAWNELRLHPLLMKSICRLGFHEPTPIQKACIPAAAHQGKDVVGAAETGSGKTLAFGLPILQRLLEEREKVTMMLEEKGEEAEKFAPKGVLRALIITPTRELALQVTDHLKDVAKGINIRVVPIVGGMSTEKQERLLKARPEIIVGTPGRLWELMSRGEEHLVELHSLSFFVLDEADRMVENGHFRELQSITDLLPMTDDSTDGQSQNTQSCVTVASFQRKKRQTFVFSATVALSAVFRKKLKHGSIKSKQSMTDKLISIETLSERAGIRANVAVIDLTNASVLATKLEESFIECREEDKDAYLYYIFRVHGQGRTIVFCTSIAALRHISSLLRILGINVWTLHAQMQQRARLKAIDRFRSTKHGILLATDVAARGLDIPGVRTVVHYQLPHSAEVYVHRSGRTARASADGCSIALISPNETAKFASLCKSFSKVSFKHFPLENSYMPEVMKQLSLAHQIDKILRKVSQDKAQKCWFERNAESVELVVENYESEEERVNSYKKKKVGSMQLKKLQQELKTMVSHPLQPKTFSRRYFAGAGVSPLMQHQFEELAKKKPGENQNSGDKRRGLMVIGQDCIEPLQALRSYGHEVHMDLKGTAEKRKNVENLKRKRKDEKKRLRDQRRKQKKRLKGGDE